MTLIDPAASAPLPRRVQHPVPRILKIVAAHYRVAPQSLLVALRRPQAAPPRHIAMHLAYVISSCSQRELQRRFRCDRVTPLRAARRISAAAEADPGLALTLAALRRRIDGETA